MKTIAALFGLQSWAMHRDHLAALDARLAAVVSLTRAGMSPAESRDAAWNGGTTVAAEIVGPVASLEIYGDLIARAPWWAKAFAGVIDPYDVAAAFDALATNAAITTIEVEVDCCGGTVNGALEIADALARCQAAGKQVVVRCAGVMASAAYLALCRADVIQASAMSLVGNIGVCITLADTTGADQAQGVAYRVVASSPIKAALAGNGGKVDSLQVDQYQQQIDAQAALFFQTVSAARDLTGPALDAVTTGAIWVGAAAQAVGLIDAVASPADEVDQPDGTGPGPDPAPVEIGQGSGARSPIAGHTPPAAPAAPSTPTAAAVISQESPMDAKLMAALAALSDTHPTHAAALVREASKPGATEASLRDVIAQAQAKAAADELVAIKAKLAQAEADLAAAKADAQAKTAALAKVNAHGQTSDPGAGDPAAESVTITGAKFMAMSPAQRSEHIKKHGIKSVAG